jgi:arginine decarboxylase-like protein
MGSRGHNLFGSPAVARVFISGGPAESVLRKVDFRASETHFKRDNFYVSVKSGQSTADVLQDFGVESDELLEWMKDNTPRQSVATKQLLSTYERILGTQTYLESF